MNKSTFKKQSTKLPLLATVVEKISTADNSVEKIIESIRWITKNAIDAEMLLSSLEYEEEPEHIEDPRRIFYTHEKLLVIWSTDEFEMVEKCELPIMSLFINRRPWLIVHIKEVGERHTPKFSFLGNKKSIIDSLELQLIIFDTDVWFHNSGIII